MKPNELSGAIIGAAIAVHRDLGPGHEEIAYEQALSRELQSCGTRCVSQHCLPLDYKGIRLDCGYRLDLLVAGTIVVEIKSVESILPVHAAQLVTYLRLGGWKLGLLINFNEAVLKSGIHRKVFGLEEGNGGSRVPRRATFNAEVRRTQKQHSDGLTEDIIGAAMEVHTRLGPGLLESAYRACFQHELSLRGLSFTRDQPVQLVFHGEKLRGGGAIDFVINNRVVIRLVVADETTRVHHEQLRSQLKFSGCETGLLLNFNVARLADGLHRVGIQRTERALSKPPTHAFSALSQSLR